MNINIADIALTSLETATFFDILTGDWMFTMDELQNMSISNAEEKTDITGKQGRKLTSLKRNKSATITGNSGLVSCGLMEVQTGGKFEQKTTPVAWYEALTVKGAKATTTYKAVGENGSEISGIYVRDADGVLGSRMEQNSAVGAGKFTYDPSTKALAFNSDVADGTVVVVYYKRNIAAAVLANRSDLHSGKAEAFIDALGEDKCGKVYRVQIHIAKADFSGEFNLDIGDSQTVHNFTIEALAGAGCGTASAGGNLWEYTVFGADAADAA